MSVSRVKISKLAKLLNRILLLEGLEQVAGSREENMEVELKKDNGWWWWWWWWWWYFIIVTMVGIISLLAAMAMMWRRIKALEDKIQQMKDDNHVDVMTQGAMTYEVEEKVKRLERR